MSNKQLKKPSWFRWSDLVAFVGSGLVILALAIYAAVVGVSGTYAVQGLVLTAIVGVLFIVFWARAAVIRKNWLDTFTWYPTYGFMVHVEDGWHAPDEATFDAEVERTIVAWQQFFSNARDVVMSDIKWVTFRKDFDETTLNPAHRKVNGLTIAGSHTFGVDFDAADDPVEKTAFAHELGHVIMGNASGDWNEANHHRFMKEKGLR